MKSLALRAGGLLVDTHTTCTDGLSGLESQTALIIQTKEQADLLNIAGGFEVLPFIYGFWRIAGYEFHPSGERVLLAHELQSEGDDGNAKSHGRINCKPQVRLLERNRCIGLSPIATGPALEQQAQDEIA